MRVRLTPWLAAVLVVSFVFAIFARTLTFGLYLDDNHHARPWALGEVLGTFVGPFDPLAIEPPYFRPLPVVTFALDWALWRYDAWGYHLTNVALHALASVLVLALLRCLRFRGRPALLGAMFFAAIPANAATAIYVSERSDAMVAIFGIGTLLAVHRYGRQGRARWLVVANLLLLCALCSKEIAVAVPVLVPLFWLYLVLDRGTVGERLPGAGQGAGSALVAGLRALGRRLRATVLHVERRRRALRVCVPPLVILALYGVHRTLVLPTGLVSARYRASSPLRGFLSAALWTWKGVPWRSRRWRCRRWWCWWCWRWRRGPAWQWSDRWRSACSSSPRPACRSPTWGRSSRGCSTCPRSATPSWWPARSPAWPTPGGTATAGARWRWRGRCRSSPSPRWWRRPPSATAALRTSSCRWVTRCCAATGWSRTARSGTSLRHHVEYIDSVLAYARANHLDGAEADPAEAAVVTSPPRRAPDGAPVLPATDSRRRAP